MAAQAVIQYPAAMYQVMNRGDRREAKRPWDATTGKELATAQAHSKGLFNARFSPDGRRIVTTSYDLTARVWDASTDRQLFSLPAGHDFTVEDADFSPDGRFIATAGDRLVKLWDAKQWR